MMVIRALDTFDEMKILKPNKSSDMNVDFLLSLISDK